MFDLDNAYNKYFKKNITNIKINLKNKTIKLPKIKIREHEFLNCHQYLDYNTVENIMFEGIKLYMKEVKI